jgi:hypothetical protein
VQTKEAKMKNRALLMIKKYLYIAAKSEILLLIEKASNKVYNKSRRLEVA